MSWNWQHSLVAMFCILIPNAAVTFALVGYDAAKTRVVRALEETDRHRATRPDRGPELRFDPRPNVSKNGPEGQKEEGRMFIDRKIEKDDRSGAEDRRALAEANRLGVDDWNPEDTVPGTPLAIKARRDRKEVRK